MAGQDTLHAYAFHVIAAHERRDVSMRRSLRRLDNQAMRQIEYLTPIVAYVEACPSDVEFRTCRVVEHAIAEYDALMTWRRRAASLQLI